MTTRYRRREVTFAETDRKPSEHGGRRNGRKDVEISGDAASQRSAMVRSDPDDPKGGR